MNKIGLLKLIESATDDQDINDLILGHEEFKGLGNVDLTKLTVDDFKKLVTENAAISGYNQSTLDSAISKAINSHDEKFKAEKLPKILEEELKKANNKDKTPEQIALEELQAKFNNLEIEKAKAEMSSKYTKILTEKGLNSDLLNFILGSDEETTDKNIETLSNIINSSVTSGIEKEITKDPPMPQNSVGIKEDAALRSVMGLE